MTPCLLCPSPAAADGLCVEDGARLWAAELWTKRPAMALWRVQRAREDGDPGGVLGTARYDAIHVIDSQAKAQTFLARLDAAREDRKRREDACCTPCAVRSGGKREHV